MEENRCLQQKLSNVEAEEKKCILGFNESTLPYELSVLNYIFGPKSFLALIVFNSMSMLCN